MTTTEVVEETITPAKVLSETLGLGRESFMPAGWNRAVDGEASPSFERESPTKEMNMKPTTGARLIVTPNSTTLSPLSPRGFSQQVSFVVRFQ